MIRNDVSLRNRAEKLHCRSSIPLPGASRNIVPQEYHQRAPGAESVRVLG
jgi:hypothetical protein